jgi:hypothetical protein
VPNRGFVEHAIRSRVKLIQAKTAVRYGHGSTWVDESFEGGATHRRAV